MFFSYTEHFSATYASARQKFVDAARAAGAALASYPYPGSRGIDGEALSIDVAQLGDAASPRQLVMISATHGMEGYAGAALQTAYLRSRAGLPAPQSIGVVLVHALNPHGFSHGLRTTEGGVDLNRNFVDHTAGTPQNEGYDELHPHLTANAADPAAWAAAETALAAARARIGEDALFDALARGQYRHPDGLFYGGEERTWENHTLEQIAARYLGRAQKIAAIDWHTGIGAYGKPFYLACANEQSDAYRQTLSWWGADGLSAARPHGRSRPRYSGLVVDGLRAFLPHAQLAGGVIEWGTRGPVAGDLAIRQDLWLRKHRHQYPADTIAQIRADLLDSLNPVSYLWRASVLALGIDIISATADGLAGW